MLSRDTPERWHRVDVTRGIGTLLLLVDLAILGCAGNSSQPAPVPTQEIHKESDRFFDKMKQEERERGPNGQQPTP